jgi:hypothetical protein
LLALTLPLVESPEPGIGVVGTFTGVPVTASFVGVTAGVYAALPFWANAGTNTIPCKQSENRINLTGDFCINFTHHL